MAGDQVGVDRQAQQPQAGVEVVLPHRRVPLGQLLAAPDVVDQHVQAALLGVDALHERLDLGRIEVVDRDGDPLAAGGADELGGLLDRLRPVVLRPPLAGAAAGAVDGRAGLAQRDRGAAAGAARRARHERHLAGQRTRHGGHPTHPPGRRGSGADGDAHGRPDREHGQQDECAAGQLGGPERLAEDEERQRDGDHRLERREDRRGRRADALQPGEEEADGPDRRDDGDAGQPAEALPRSRRSGSRSPVDEAAERQGRRRAGADERAERERADARGDALRGEDVGAVDDRGAQPQRRADRVQRAGGRSGQHQHEPGRGEHEGERPSASSPARARARSALTVTIAGKV